MMRDYAKKQPPLPPSRAYRKRSSKKRGLFLMLTLLLLGSLFYFLQHRKGTKPALHTSSLSAQSKPAAAVSKTPTKPASKKTDITFDFYKILPNEPPEKLASSSTKDAE